MHQSDPTRIPKLIAALQETWEGQPDLALPAFLGMLHNRGLSWASSEEELLHLLSRIQTEHPSLIDGPLNAPVVFSTSSPRFSVTMTGSKVVVRSGEDAQRMPSVWTYTNFRPAGPGRPLVITDEEGIEHRFGVIDLATVFDPRSAPSLAGLKRTEVGAARWLVTFASGERAVLGQRLRVWATHGRETEVETYTWGRVETLEPGSDMRLAPADGGKPTVLGPVSEIVLLEV